MNSIVPVATPDQRWMRFKSDVLTGLILITINVKIFENLIAPVARVVRPRRNAIQFII